MATLEKIGGPVRIDGRWYWVTTDGANWTLAKHREKGAANGWTNEDTWEDFNGDVIAWRAIEPPRA